ncbi:MAG: hypothetical protein HC915_11800 [Anaerolineae bacterium]|nr:hypothetical protein [Anaerolineae bacterium]
MSGLRRHLEPFRLLHERLDLLPLRQEVARPGVNEALRLSICLADPAERDRVALLRRGSGPQCGLALWVERAEKPLFLEFKLPPERYQQVLAALRTSKFDTLDDDPDVGAVGQTLWLLERGSGAFVHDVVLAPQGGRGHHRELALAVRKLLPEALRPVNL